MSEEFVSCFNCISGTAQDLFDFYNEKIKSLIKLRNAGYKFIEPKQRYGFVNIRSYIDEIPFLLLLDSICRPSMVIIVFCSEKINDIERRAFVEPKEKVDE